jgi:hypothetical protein
MDRASDFRAGVANGRVVAIAEAGAWCRLGYLPGAARFDLAALEPLSRVGLKYSMTYS